MLKEMEQREALRPVEERTDIAYLWREPGLEQAARRRTAPALVRRRPEHEDLPSGCGW